MPFKLKTSRKEVSIKRSAVITWHKAGKSCSQIAPLEALHRNTVASIIRPSQLRPGNPIYNKKRSARPRKISKRDERMLCRKAEADNEVGLQAVSTPSKFGHTLT